MKRLLALLLFVACGGGSSTAGPDPDAAVLGTYALMTYNGANLPTAGIISGAMQVAADHYEFTYSGAGFPNIYDERGTWRLNGATIVLHSNAAVNGQTPPDWSGNIGSGNLSMAAETNPSWVNLHPAMTFVR
jgi:hypothetical protein